MAALAITLFMMAIIGAFFIMPFKIKKFSSNIVADYIFKKSCLMLGFGFLLLFSAMLATIADAAGIELTQEIFRVMFFIGWGCRIMLLWLFVGTIFKSAEHWKELINQRRMGQHKKEDKY